MNSIRISMKLASLRITAILYRGVIEVEVALLTLWSMMIGKAYRNMSMQSPAIISHLKFLKFKSL